MTDTEFGYGCFLFIIGLVIGFSTLLTDNTANEIVGLVVLVLSGAVGGLLLAEVFDR